MTFDEMTEAVEEAERTIRMADIATRKVAKLIIGRLRSIKTPSWVLAELKRELRDYNIHTGQWKDR